MTYAGNVNIRSVLVADTFNQSIDAGEYIFKNINGDPAWYDVVGQRLTILGFYTIEISFANAGVLSMDIRDPTTSEIVSTTMYEGDTLTDNALYIFTVAITEPYQINFKYSVDSTVKYALLTSHGGVY